MATMTIRGVELVRAGTWNASTGRVTISPADLDNMVTASANPEIDGAPIKLGHVDPRFDGEPALGWVKNLRLSSDGTVLVGDLVDVPAQLADIIPSAYPRRSVEIAWMKDQGGAVLTGLALLGVTPPAVKGLADVYRVAATEDARTDTPSVFAVHLATDTCGIPITVNDTGQPSPHQQSPRAEESSMGKTTQAAEAAADTTTEQDSGVDPAETTSTTDQTENPDSTEGDSEENSEPVTANASASDAPAVVTLSAGQYEELMRGAQAGAAALAQIDATRRDTILNTALAEGRLTPADQATWRSALDKDEAGTVALLATLPPQRVPTVPAGSALADGTDPLDAEFEAFEKRLFEGA